MTLATRGGTASNHRAADRARIPTPQWALGKIRDTGDEKAESRCRNMVRDSVRAARDAGMLRGGIVVAIDSNLQEYYGNTKGGEDGEDTDTVPMTVRSRSKNGTNDFVGHVVMQGIGPQAKVFLGARHLEPGSSVPDLVGSLLRELPRMGINATMVLVDRGHFSVRNMQVLDAAGHRFIMPAVKNKKIKGVIREHADGKGPKVVDYIVRSKEHGEFTFRLIICKKAGYEGSDPVEGHVVFATNMTRRTCLKYSVVKKSLQSDSWSDSKDVEFVSRIVAWNSLYPEIFCKNFLTILYFDMIPDEYKARWEIETGFRCAEEVRGMTRSRSLAVRLALFCFSLLFYNAWTISRFLETNGGDPGLWPRCITLGQSRRRSCRCPGRSCAPIRRCMTAAAADAPGPRRARARQPFVPRLPCALYSRRARGGLSAARRGRHSGRRMRLDPKNSGAIAANQRKTVLARVFFGIFFEVFAGRRACPAAQIFMNWDHPKRRPNRSGGQAQSSAHHQTGFGQNGCVLAAQGGRIPAPARRRLHLVVRLVAACL